MNKTLLLLPILAALAAGPMTAQVTTGAIVENPAPEASPQAAPAPPAPPAPPAAPAKVVREKVVHAMALSGSGNYLGVGVQEIDAERAKALKLKEEHGVEITKVEEDSPASKAGLKEGDVVLEYNGQRVEGTEQFVRMVHETPAGRQARLVISRNGSSQKLSATIGTRKGGAMAGFSMDPKFQQEMSRLQTKLSEMRYAMPDMPHAYMSWRSGALGVEAESLSAQLAEFFGVKEGVLVRSVNKDSAAEKGGLKAGDVIVKIDQTKVSTPSEVTNAIRGLQEKKTFPVTVVRSRQETTLSVTIDEQSSRRIEPRPVRVPRPATTVRPGRTQFRMINSGSGVTL